MICVNEFGSAKVTNKKFVETYLVLLSPFAPHLAEELWAKLGHSTSVQKAPWPEADPKLLVADSMKIMVQVNGKLRGQLEAPISASQEEVFALALANPDVQKFIEGKEIKKKIYVPKKLVNFVAP
jgi:leucyl-tRNA synthetase